MNENDLLRRIAITKAKPETVTDLQPRELAELVLVVLQYAREIKQQIEEGKIKGDPGEDGKDGAEFIPQPDVDYLSLPTAKRELENFKSEVISKVLSDVQNAILSLENGKDGIDGAPGKDGLPGKDGKDGINGLNGLDAVVTEADIKQAADLAFKMIELPDFRIFITEQPEAIRDSLELLKDDDRLDASAIKGLEKFIKDAKPEMMVGGIRFLSQLADVRTVNLANGDVLKWNSTTLQWENAADSGGVTDHGALTGLADDDHPQYHNDARGDLRYSLLAHTHTLATGATDVTASASELNILDGATLSTTELNYVDGVTSSIQTQLDSKEVPLTFGDGLTRTGNDVDLDTTLTGLVSVSSTTFIGDLTGNVTGNVTGDVTGNLTGNVTGDVVGNVTGNLTGNADTATFATSAGTASTATTLLNTRTLWGQNFNGSANVTGSLTAVQDITGGASNMIITSGTGNSRTLTLRTTTSGGTATNALTITDAQNVGAPTFNANFSVQPSVTAPRFFYLYAPGSYATGTAGMELGVRNTNGSQQGIYGVVSTATQVTNDAALGVLYGGVFTAEALADVNTAYGFNARLTTGTAGTVVADGGGMIVGMTNNATVTSFKGLFMDFVNNGTIPTFFGSRLRLINNQPMTTFHGMNVELANVSTITTANGISFTGYSVGAGITTNRLIYAEAGTAVGTTRHGLYFLPDMPSYHVGKFGIGTNVTAPTARLQVRDTAEQMRLEYDASNYWTAITNSTGVTTFNAVGSGTGATIPRFEFSDAVILRAGTATAGTAPIKFVSGISLTAAEAGAMEFTTDDLFFTITTGTARKRLLMADPTGGLTSGRVPFATTNGRLTDDADFTFATDTLTVAKTATTRIKGTSSAPAIAGGAGAGTTPTVAITGTDLAGEITVTTDVDPAAGSVFCTITFTSAFGTAPYVVITPSNDNAVRMYNDKTWDASFTTAVYVTSTTTTFELNTNSVAFPIASTEFKFMYHVIE